MNLRSHFPRASESFFEANETKDLCPLPNPEPQPNQAAALDRAAAGEKKSVRRVRVRLTGHRVRTLDPDNFAAGCKDLLDGLRHAGLIPGDEPWRIIFETAQTKVQSFAQERTMIEIEW